MRKLSAILLGAALAAVPVLGWAQHTPNSQKKWAWLNFERPAGVNPVISPRPSSVFNCPMQGRPIGWEESETFNPAATIKGDSIIVLYRAEDNTHQGIGSRTSRLGYAASADGIHFNRRPQPVFYPDNDSQAANEHPGGCEDPRVAVTEDGVYVMFYTQWNHKYAQLAVATSRDLLHWTKHGPVFGSNKRYPGTKYTKSASILTKMKNGRQVITKLNGKYVMFWGEYFVNVATSDDLIHWTPTLDDKGNILKAMSPRRGYFDSMLTECGPPALLTKKGYAVRRICPVDMFPHTNHVETVCQLVLRNPVTHINIDVDVEEMVQDKRGQATYSQIKEYVLEHSELKVSSLYIA